MGNSWGVWALSDFRTARSIALNWLDGVSPLDEDMLRRAAEIAVQAVNSRPGAEVDAEALIRELEANLNVLVGAASTLTDEQSDHFLGCRSGGARSSGGWPDGTGGFCRSRGDGLCLR